MKLLPTSSTYLSNTNHPKGDAERPGWDLNVRFTGKCLLQEGYSELGRVKEINQDGNGGRLPAAGAHINHQAGGIAR
ncbi:hypothetical protein BCD67_11590 [Oscillatoriales cyanobacterium USR001]|nr:hypothetical protein BCD67_11590 [Oscillatoriales cyanobacterium USR001]